MFREIVRRLTHQICTATLQELMDDISEDPERLGDFGVNNPAILADSLYRMKGTKQGNA